ncbi:MAG: tyrosine-type recombinase/integrase [Gemmataceae bacterium]
MSKSTRPSLSGKRKSKVVKPSKPYPDFPLFPHATKRWAKKIKGRMVYFGSWDDPQAAVDKYLRDKEDLYAGRVPRAVEPDGFTLRDVVNRFLTSKRHLFDTREITARTFADYYACCERLVDHFGMDRLVDDIRAEDFEAYRAQLAKRFGHVSLGNEITRIRVCFKFAYDSALIDRPIRYGPGFKRPSKKTLRKERAKNGVRMFEAEQIHKMLGAASLCLKAMILLGANAALGNTDLAALPESALDLKSGWLSYARVKTGISRRVPLWPETVQALREVISNRPKAKDPADKDLVFLTRFRTPWVKIETKEKDGQLQVRCDDAISKESAKLLALLKLKRRGLSFYALRHGFETIAGETKDQPAVDAIMGHSRDDMASTYRERIGDDRLKAVVDHVHDWLFPLNQNK